VPGKTSFREEFVGVIDGQFNRIAKKQRIVRMKRIKPFLGMDSVFKVRGEIVIEK
jgi:hypothetical protein